MIRKKQIYVIEHAQKDMLCKIKNSADCYCNGIPKKRNDVVINTDNWQEYFEFYTKVDWRKDDFGDITGLSASQNIKLKDIYHDKLVKKSVIKFKIEGKVMHVQ